jgi:hypothetical protein
MKGRREKKKKIKSEINKNINTAKDIYKYLGMG